MKNNFTNRLLLFLCFIFSGLVFAYFGDIAENVLKIFLYVVGGVCIVGSIVVPFILYLQDNQK